MIKLIKLCFICCLIFRATFVEADYQKYKEYIEELAKLEQKYRDVDKMIDLSDYTMSRVINMLHSILQLRAHTQIGIPQKEPKGESHPALLKVNGVVYELYFLGTKGMPGNCRLKRQENRWGNPWKEKETGKYNSKLKTKENYVEQNLLFCLEIARRKLCCGEDKDLTYDKFYDAKILDVIASELKLVDENKDYHVEEFLDCFVKPKERDEIAENFIKKYGPEDKDLIIWKLNFLYKKITNGFFPLKLADFLNNKDILEKLKSKGFKSDIQTKSLKLSEYLKIKKAINAIESADNDKKTSNEKGNKYKENNLKNTSDKFLSKQNNSKEAKNDSKTENDEFIYIWKGFKENTTKDLQGVSVSLFENGELGPSFSREKYDYKYYRSALLQILGADGTTRWLYLKNPELNSKNKTKGEIYLVDVH